MRCHLETLRGRIKVSEVPLPTKPVDEAIKQAIEVFDTHMIGRPLELRDSFEKWKSASEEAVRDEIGHHLDTVVKNNRRMDACRGISGLQVVVFRGIAPSSNRLLDLRAEEFTRLGDGTASYDRKEGWSVTQKKGDYTNTSHLLVRTHRR